MLLWWRQPEAFAPNQADGPKPKLASPAMAAAVAMASVPASTPAVEQPATATKEPVLQKSEMATADPTASRVTVRTPQIHWHGKSPVFAVDFHPTFPRLCVTGGSEPDGSGGVHLWLMNEGEHAEKAPVDFVQDLQGHEKTVNCLRFSPNGELLASAGVEGAVVIWRRASAATSAANAKAGGERWEYLTMLRAQVLDVCDLSWSPSSQQIVTACVDNTAAVYTIFAKEKVAAHIRSHDHFVLGVAWDPAEEYILTISSDRTCRLHTSASRKWKGDVRVAHVARSMEFPQQGSGSAVLQLVTSSNPGEEAGKQKARDFKLFLDDTLAAHRRRPAWSPDGLFAVVPGGVHQSSNSSPQTFVTHLIARRNPTKPFAFLPAGKQPTVAARFCPVGFKLRKDNADPGSLPTPEKLFSNHQKTQTCSTPFNMPYRMLFAVASLDAITVYDTQQMGKPLLHVRGIHFTPLTDLSWSTDGRHLVATSSDGYCTIIEFAPGELGEPSEIPLATMARTRAREEQPGGATEDGDANAKASPPSQATQPPPAPVPGPAPAEKSDMDGPAAKQADESAAKKRRIIPKVVNGGEGAAPAGAACSGPAAADTSGAASSAGSGARESAGSSGEPIVLEDSRSNEEDNKEQAMPDSVADAGQDEAASKRERAAAGPAGDEQHAEDGAVTAAAAEASAISSDAEKQAPKKRRIVPCVVTPAPPS